MSLERENELEYIFFFWRGKKLKTQVTANILRSIILVLNKYQNSFIVIISNESSSCTGNIDIQIFRVLTIQPHSLFVDEIIL